jgi:photosystem II stability/assembly factor-like uncharacterized protein
LAQWSPLGPDGGDVRSLTYDPQNPGRLFLGTSAGQLFVSTSNGASWSRFARLGSGNDYVLDNMEIDPQSGVMYVAAWSVENNGGDLFRSRDGGRTWQMLPDVHGKSIRAMELAPSDPKIVVVGALDGVFRSRDGGDTFERISPPNHAEIKDIESLAIDPKNPDAIYAGTWHLPWKTDDGGHSWHSIKRGVIDDSDVFSIIVDRSNPQVVYLSACSGIYKSENAGELFRKVKGIPFSARRTRVLKQDPVQPGTVYAGTTEGLWKTIDAGRNWKRITPANIIVNDVHVDPREPARVLIATDRSGVLASTNAGQTFAASNRGFSHRQVWSVLADRNDPQTIYAGVVNDKDFGGVFVSHDGGREWKQLAEGIGGLDIFALQQAQDGAVLAGTEQGIYMLRPGSGEWQPVNTVLRQKTVPALKKAGRKSKKKVERDPQTELVRAELNARVISMELTPAKWFAASNEGLFTSTDEGKAWKGGPVLGHREFIGVKANGSTVMALTSRAVLLSRDDGQTWGLHNVPSWVTAIYGGTITPKSVVWLATREGALRSTDLGVTWEHVLGGLPSRNLANVTYDPESQRLLAVASNGELFASSDAGQSWQRRDAGFAVRSLSFAHGRLLAATAFDGVIAQPEPVRSQTASAGAGAPQR